MIKAFSSCRFMFQFVPSRGGQPGPDFPRRRLTKFQFVPSRGGQQCPGRALQGPGAGFNSCPHAEGNLIPRKFLAENFVSIRALTRRATAVVNFSGGRDVVSIRALTRRATRPKRRECFAGEFQFVPSRGGQRRDDAYLNNQQPFQFVPSRGGQPEPNVGRVANGGFNSCPHAEGNRGLNR